MRVAVVRNMSRDGVVNAFGQLSGELSLEQTAEAVAGALRDSGHTVAVFEGDKYLLDALERFMPGRNRTPGGMVFNLARGIQGEAARLHVPAMLEMAGVPYTGPGPVAHALASDAAANHALLKEAGIATPRGCLVRWWCDSLSDWSWPLAVTPRRADVSFGRRVVWNAEQLKDAIEEVAVRCEQDAFVLEHGEGVRISAWLIGNGGDVATYWSSGAHRQPFALEPRLARQLRSAALAAFRLCGCQDYAQVDLRVNPDGLPLVVGVEPMPALHRDGGCASVAGAAGVDYASLLTRILDVAYHRYFGVAAPRFDAAGEGSDPVYADADGTTGH